MNIIFFGTGRFGIPALEALIGSRHEIVAVVTGPDRKRERGHNVRSTPVKALVEGTSPRIDVLQPEKVSERNFIDTLRGLNADVFVVIDYGQMLSGDLLEVPRRYCINLHPSLLPKYRGAAPVNRAILGGEKETGNTVIKMNERMDAGDIIAQEDEEIDVSDNAEELHERLSRNGAGLVLAALEAIEAEEECPVAQDESQATYAPKLEKEEGRINWERPAREILIKIRGMQPWPGAFTSLDGKVLKVLAARTADAQAGNVRPGAVLAQKPFTVAASDGAIIVDRLQVEGKKAMSPDEFTRGNTLQEGIVLGE